MLSRVNGTELFWESHGSGRPVLLMHGGPGLDHSYFRPWLDPLGDAVRLLYYDQRATGRSARNGALEGVSLRTLVDDAEALRVHLGLERIVLFGHSFGGRLALAYALQYGHRLDGLVLCATAPGYEHLRTAIATLTARATPEQRAMLANAFSGPMPDDGALKCAWEALLPLYFARYRATYAKALLGRVRFGAAAWNHFGQLLDDLNANVRLGGAGIPALVLAGGHDWFTPPEQIARLRDALPAARVARFERSGHFPFVEEQGQFVAIVKSWIAALGGTARV
jgi:proline iminopeptidase